MNSKYVALPMATDTEAETSVDVEKSLEYIEKPAESTARRRSLFNLTVELKTEPAPRKSDNFRSIEERGRKEVRAWNDLYRSLRSELKSAKQKHSVVDLSILPEEKRKFVEEEPNLDHYLRILHEFQCNALKFLENDFIVMLERRERLQQLCKKKINLAKKNKIRELLRAENF